MGANARFCREWRGSPGEGFRRGISVFRDRRGETGTPEAVFAMDAWPRVGGWQDVEASVTGLRGVRLPEPADGVGGGR